MRKRLSVLIVTGFLLAFSACGSTDAEADATEQTKVNQESDSDFVQLMFDWSDETKDFQVDLYENEREEAIPAFPGLWWNLKEEMRIK